MQSYFVEACHTRGSIRLATLVLIALALLAAPSAKADCILFRHSTGGAEYINLQGRNFFGSRFPLYADTDCQTRHPTHDSGWYLGGVAYASNSDSARSICAAKHRAPIRGVSPVGNGFWRCDINGDQGAAPGTQGGESPALALALARRPAPALPALRRLRFRWTASGCAPLTAWAAAYSSGAWTLAASAFNRSLTWSCLTPSMSGRT